MMLTIYIYITLCYNTSKDKPIYREYRPTLDSRHLDPVLQLSNKTGA
nr:MAG TPA: hypothetical protein [Caudoviricetes sp.]